MSGLLAIYAFDEMWSLNSYVRYGLMALQHRGTERYVVCTAANNTECCVGDRIEDVAVRASDHKAIAAAYSTADGGVHQETINSTGIALLAEREHKALSELTRELAKALSKNPYNDVPATLRAYSDIDDLPSFVALSNRGEVLAWRSPSGLTPMVLGGYGFDMTIVSSESTAIDILDADVRKFVSPGELVYQNRFLLKSFNAYSNTKPRLCLFELLYLARHDAIVEGVSVYEFRKSLGRELATTFDKDVDAVMGVPETAIPYALGLSNAIGKPFELAFVATGSRSRSMLRADPREKLIAIHLKMNPVRSSLEGKRIALVDDSMVTGATAKTVSQILRYRIGVEEIHLLIASPPLVTSCPYNVMKLNIESLLAANLSKDDGRKVPRGRFATLARPRERR
uniref:Amidophosphoribosyltransferase n=1 Tax=Ignisphaera aggregans TaxID=334771 RepID=A0A7C2ZN51_9CREN